MNSRTFVKLFILLFLLLNVGLAFCREQRFEGETPHSLMEKSLITPSSEEKKAIRSYLATVYPDTMPGLFSKGWLADSSKDKDSAVKYYRQCVQHDPSAVFCFYNGLTSDALRKDRVFLQKAEQALSGQNSDDELSLLEMIYKGYRYGLDDEAVALDLLSRWQVKLPGHPINDYLRGCAADDREERRDHYLKAIENGADFFFLYKRYTDALLLSTGTITDVEELQTVLLKMSLFLRMHPNDARPLLYIADKLTEHGYSKYAYELYCMAYDLYPHIEVVKEIYRRFDVVNLDQAGKIFEQAKKDMPWSPEVFRILGKYYKHYALNMEKSRQAFKHAIELSTTRSEKAKSVLAMVDEYVLDVELDFHKAREMLSKWKGEEEGYVDLSVFLSLLYEEKYKEALLLLDGFNIESNFKKSYIEMHKNRVEQLLEDKRKVTSYYEKNPFLKKWEEKFGSSLKVTVNFATGRAEIPQRDFHSLSKIAKVLNEEGADEYIFQIEGHTDSVGGDVINIPLSKRRAEAVKEHLTRYYNISPARLRVRGFGAQHPVSSNQTESGRALNRRVEVIPMGKLTDPQIAVTTVLRPDNVMDISRDGMKMIVGSSPLQLWDLRDGSKIRDFGKVDRAYLSPDGRYVAGFTNQNEVGGFKSRLFKIFDVKTGLPIVQKRWMLDIDDICWDPYGKRVAISGVSFLSIFSLDTMEVVKHVKAVPGYDRCRVKWSRDGERVYMYRMGTTDSVFVFDSKTLALIKNFGQDLTYIHALNENIDGSKLVVHDNEGMIWVIDTKNGDVKKKHIGSPAPKRIVAHPVNPNLVLLNDFVNRRDGEFSAAYFDLNKMEIVLEVEADDNAHFVFNSDGSKLYVRNRHSVDVLDPETLEYRYSIVGGGTECYSVFQTAAENTVFTSDSEGIHAWDLLTGKKLHRWLINGSRVGDRKGYDIFLGKGNGQIQKIDTKSFVLSDFGDVDFRIQDLELYDQYVVVAGREKQSENGTTSKEGHVVVFDKKSGDKVFSLNVPLVTDMLRWDGNVYGSGFTDVALSEDGGKLAVSTYWVDGFGHRATFSRYVRIFDTKSGELLQEIKVDDGQLSVFFLEDNSLEITGDYHTYTYNLTGELLESKTRVLGQWSEKFTHDGIQYTFQFSSSGFTLADSRGNIKRKNFSEGQLKSYVALPEKNMLVVATKDNELLMYQLPILSKQLTIVSRPDNEWIAYTSSGEYASSLDGTKEVKWFLGDDSLEFSALKYHFERPDLVADRISNIIAGMRQVKASDNDSTNKPDIDVDMFVVPFKVSLLSPTNITTDDETYVFSMEIDWQSRIPESYEIEYLHNGRVLPRERKIAKMIKINSKTRKIEEIIQLVPGLNIIQAFVVYKGARLSPISARITLDDARQEVGIGTAKALNTHLWFFGVGISEYQDKSANLDYAHKDVEMLAKALKQQEGKIFGKVHTMVLQNDNANARDVQLGMHKFLKRASSNDVILLFFAGHGMKDTDQSLYLMTHDSDFSMPFSGLDLKIVHDFVRKRPRNQKALMFMDVCHAGALGQDEERTRGRMTAEETLKNLMEGTGMTVLASSTGLEFSLEGKRFSGGHGAFTASLLDGLKGNADTQTGNSDGVVTVLELQNYVSRVVPEITNGRQHPTTPNMENFRDYPLAVP